MNFQTNQKVEISINGLTIGNANGVSVDRNNGKIKVNITKNSTSKEKINNKVESYDEFFSKFAKAFK